MKPDDFSIGFADALFTKYPDWEKYEQYIDYDDKRYPYSYLLVEVPSPLSGEGHKLVIYTEDGEVTICFDKYHTHQSYIEDEETYEQALNFIQELIEEKIIVVTMEGEQWRSSQTIRIGERLPRVSENQRTYIRSWKGTYDMD